MKLTPKQRVVRKYPNAFAHQYPRGWWIEQAGKVGGGPYDSAREGWADVAKRLKR